MNKDVENLKVVKILDAVYCVRCSFAYVADVLLTDGRRKKMFYCSRRDCDNWRTEVAGVLEGESETAFREPSSLLDSWELEG